MQTRAAAALILVVAGAAQAQLGSVSMSFMGVGAGRSSRIELDGRSMNVFAGQLRHYVLDGTGIGIGLIGDQTTYCVDLHEYVSRAPETFTLVSLSDASNTEPMGASRARAIGDVLSSAGDSAWAATGADLGAAIQLALWEIAYDYSGDAGAGSLNFADGRFKASQMNGSPLSSSVLSLAEGLFGAIGSSGGQGIGIAASAPGLQDQVFRVVPAPGSIALAGLGLLMLRIRRAR